MVQMCKMVDGETFTVQDLLYSFRVFAHNRCTQI